MNEQATVTAQRKPLAGTRTGKVVAAGRAKTIKVIAASVTKEGKYGKYVSHRSAFHVHDENNEAAVGDTVEVAPCRPISKTKSWRLVKVLTRAADRVHD